MPGRPPQRSCRVWRGKWSLSPFIDFTNLAELKPLTGSVASFMAFENIWY
jgi:hypothetical protein